MRIFPARAGSRPVLLPFIERAVPRSCGRVEPEALKEGAKRGQYIIGVVGAPGQGVRAVFAMQSLDFEKKRILSVFLYSGERRRAMHLFPIVEQLARDQGFQEVQISGPRAWGRLFPDFKEAFTVYTKEV